MDNLIHLVKCLEMSYLVSASPFLSNVTLSTRVSMFSLEVSLARRMSLAPTSENTSLADSGKVQNFWFVKIEARKKEKKRSVIDTTFVYNKSMPTKDQKSSASQAMF